jgi:hypothetical protein
MALKASQVEVRFAGNTEAVQAGAPELKLRPIAAGPPEAGIVTAEGETENVAGAAAAAA